MLTKKTILGVSWTVSSRLASRLVDVITVLVLARTLTPADFGLTALAMTLIAIVDTILEIQLIQALTRLTFVEKSHLDTAFTLGVLRGLFLSLVVLGAAWPFSIIFHDDRLTLLVATLAVGPIARSLYSPGMVNYIRQMSFRQSFIAEFTGKILASTTAITFLYFGAGYWSIVASSVMSSVATTLISYVLARYRPAFSLSKISEFSTFLGWFSSAQVLSALSWQFDRALLGYFVTKSHLGQYTMATDLAVLPTQSLIGPAMQPVMAAFSRINSDPERLRNAYLKASLFTMLLVAPTCVGMSLTSDLIVSVLLGTEWNEAADYFQWLALATLLSAYFQPLASLSLAMNRPSVIFWYTLTELGLRVLLISLGLYFYSLMGVVIARGAISIVMFAVSFLTARRMVGFSAASEVFNLIRVGIACVIMAIFVLVLRHELAGQHFHAFTELIFASIFGATIYSGFLFILGIKLKTIINQFR
jgi:O-antigen/teichoic acid export membrane protein